MVHSIALEYALEQALGPAMQAFLAAAHAHAEQRGAAEVQDKDFDAILTKFKKQAKANNSPKKKQRR
eukprot:g650.t1